MRRFIVDLEGNARIVTDDPAENFWAELARREGTSVEKVKQEAREELRKFREKRAKKVL